MEENPYEPPQIRGPDEQKPRATFVVIFTPLAIPAAVVAFFTMCGAHGAMNFLQGAQLVAVIVLFAVSGIAFLFSVSFILSRWLKGE